MLEDRVPLLRACRIAAVACRRAVPRVLRLRAYARGAGHETAAMRHATACGGMMKDAVLVCTREMSAALARIRKR